VTEGKVWAPDDLARLKKMMNEFAGPVPKPRGFMDFTINIQTLVFALAAVIAGMAGWGFNTMVGYQQFQTSFDSFKVQVTEQLQSQSKDIQALEEQLNVMRQGNVQLRDQLAKWQSDSTNQNTDQQKQLSNLDKNLAVIQERITDQSHREGPHGELAIPDKYGSLKGDRLALDR
jgi:TolA-binding protein